MMCHPHYSCLENMPSLKNIWLQESLVCELTFLLLTGPTKKTSTYLQCKIMGEEEVINIPSSNIYEKNDKCFL
jgi:hypothetical protein